MDRQYFQEIGLLDEGMEVYGGENVELGIRVSRVSHPQVLTQLPKVWMSLWAGEMECKVEHHGLILNVYSLSLVHVSVTRANGDRIETQDGIYRVFGKKTTSETALAGGGDMEELSSQLKGTTFLLNPNPNPNPMVVLIVHSIGIFKQPYTSMHYRLASPWRKPHTC